MRTARLLTALALLAFLGCAHPRVRLHGVAIDLLTGEPIRDATVEVEDREARTPIAAARTDATGRYRIEFPVGSGGVHLQVLAQSAGHVPLSFAAFAKEERAACQVDFPFAPGASVRGRVVDAAGNPVGGARVTVRQEIHQEVMRVCWLHDPLEARAVSSQDGTFGPLGVAPGPYLIRVELNGFVRGESKAVLLGGEPIEVRLWPPREAEGRVVAKASGLDDTESTRVGMTRVSGIVVSAIDGVPAPGVHVWSEHRSCVTGRDGRFQFVGLSPGRHEVSIYDDDEHELQVPSAVEWNLSEGQSLDGVRIAVGELQRIRGRVLDSEGRPCAGVSVYCREGDLTTEGESLTHCWKTGEVEVLLDGTFEECLHTSDEGLEVSVEQPPVGAAAASTRRLRSFDHEGALEIHLLRRAIVMGRVLDPQGQPVGGANVSAQDAYYQKWEDDLVQPPPARADCVSDADGRYFLALPRGPWALRADAKGFAGAVERCFQVESGDEPRVIDVHVRR